MGSPIDLRSYPIFVAKRVYEIPYTKNRVVVGEEGACSYYTKVVLIESDKPIDNTTLDELRRQLDALLAKLAGQPGSTTEAG